MKIALKLFLFLIPISVIFTNSTLAFEIKDRNEYLLDARGDDGDIYLNRFSIYRQLGSPDTKISVFTETQWNIETNEWEKILAGGEVSRLFWKHLYIGQSVQFIAGELLDYMNFNVNSNSIDATTEIGVEWSFLKHFLLCVSEGYSFNLEEGRNEYAETIAQVLYTPKPSYSIGIGWRHTDRIHNFDTDYVSTSFTLRF